MIQVKLINRIVESNFTPAVYWHYVATQYFPVPRLDQGPNQVLERIRAQVQRYFAEKTHLEIPELSCLAYSSAVKHDPELKMSEASNRELIKSASVDQIMADLEAKAEKKGKTVSAIWEKVAERLVTCFDKALASSQDCLLLRSGELDRYGEDVWRKYTRGQLESLEKKVMAKENSFKEVNKVENNYFESMERKYQEELQTIESSFSGKRSHNKKGHARSVALNGTSNSNAAKKSGGLEPGQHRINTYIQNYRKKIKHVDDTVCQICNDGDYEESNKIVFCAVSLGSSFFVEM